MSIERVFYCDWRECETYVRTASVRPTGTFLTVAESDTNERHFCSWDCVLKHAAEIPPIVLVGAPEDDDPLD